MRLIAPFSLLIFLVFSFAEPLKESISLRVKVVGRIVEEKPRLIPPKKIMPWTITPLDLSAKILKPPKELEKAEIVPPPEGRGCGEPKDRAYYRAGIKLYTEGKLRKAESRLLDILSLQNSAFVPQSEYILGLIYAERGEDKKATVFFESSCKKTHPFKKAACEAWYALHLRKGGKLPTTDLPPLWESVRLMKAGEEVSDVSCEETTFIKYCTYVKDFIAGNINEDYEASTRIRRAILLIEEGKLKEAKELLLPYGEPLSPYRDVALYYLGVVALKEGDREWAYRYASLLETMNPTYSKNLYTLLSAKDILLSGIAYGVTRSEEALRNLGILSYNAGRYAVAYTKLTQAGDYLYAAWAAIKEGDYSRAYKSLSRAKVKRKEHYLWLLESLYWLRRDEEMEVVLAEIKEEYPHLYREYMGWLMFRKGRWREAYANFTEPYHKALALYNAGDYRGVLSLLEGRDSLKERILRAKAAISMGDGKRARKSLTLQTDEEVYLLGMSFFIEGNYKRAVPYFERLLKSEAFKSRAFLRIADSYYNLGDYQKARELYMTILRDYPGSGEAEDATLALAQIELQNPSPDLEYLVEEFVARFPKSPLVPDLKFQLASLYLREGKEEKAREILTELLEVETLRGRVLVKLAQIEDDPTKKEELLKEALKHTEGKDREEAVGMLMSLYLSGGEFEKLADFLSEGDLEDRKKALEIYMDENLQKAIELYERLLEESPQDEDLRKLALGMYDRTKGKKYLLIARESSDPVVRAKALYLLGKKEKDKRKALEYFVEVVMTAEGTQPYYNRSILEAVDILLSLKARRDASCLLDKLEEGYLTSREKKKVKILKEKLPACEVRK